MTDLEIFSSEYDTFWLNCPAQTKLENDLKLIAAKANKLKVARICNVTSRRKSAKSLYDKFIKETEVNGSNADVFSMEDLLGGRVTVLNKCDVFPVTQIVKRSLQQSKWSLVREKDHFGIPTKGGHRAYHLYFKRKFRGRWVFTEVQILTETADFWTLWEHFLSYKVVNVADPSRIEEQAFKTIGRRLEIIDAETNDLRLELSYYRPAYPESVLLKLPENQFLAFADENEKRRSSHSKLRRLVPNLEWLALPDRELTDFGGAFGFRACDVKLGFDSIGIFGLPSPDGRENSREVFDLEPNKEPDRILFLKCTERMGFTEDLSSMAFEVLKSICTKKSKSEKFFNGPLARLQAYQCTGQTLALWLEETSYWTLLLTNLAFDRFRERDLELSKNPVILVDCEGLKLGLQSYVEHFLTANPKGLPPILANDLAVQITLRTGDNQLIVTKRGDLATQSGLWSNSASGDLYPRKWSDSMRGDLLPLNRRDRNEEANLDHVVSPFLGASRELAEELGVFVPINQMFVQALVRSHEHCQPILLFEARTELSFDELMNSSPIAHDRWEIGEIFGIPADINGLQMLQSGFSGLTRINDTDRHIRLPSIEGDSLRQNWQEKAVASLLLSLPQEIWT